MEKSTQDQEFLNKLVGIVHSNINSEKFGVEELARQAGYSRSQLHRKLKSITKKSSSQFIRDVRLDQALELLIKDSGTCSEIAYEVGFSSPSYFDRCFKKRFGYVPSEARERHNEKNIISDYSFSMTKKKEWYIIVLIAMIGLIYLFSQVFKKSDNYNEIKSALAVLPLDNLSDNPENEFYTAGMHDAIIGALGKLSSIRVISRTSTLPFSNNVLDLQEVADKLEVDFVIEGSILEMKDSVRIQLQLIKILPKEEHIWAKEYCQPITQSFSIYNNFVQDVANEINIKLTPHEEKELRNVRELNAEMYKSYLRGMYYISRGTPDEFQKGIDHLNQAIAIDPANPLAYAQLAFGYIAGGHGSTPIQIMWQRARAAATTAIKLDSNLAEAHAALAIIKTYLERDWDTAEAEFKMANTLNPNLAICHFHYAWYLVLFGRYEEALIEHQMAKELDPLTPIYTADLGSLYYWIGEYGLALSEIESSLELNPEFDHAWWAMGNVLNAKKQYEQAIKAHRKAVQINPDWYWALANTYVLAGSIDQAKPIIDSLESTKMTSRNALGLSMIYANLGDFDKAFDWLYYEPSDFWVPGMRTWPEFDQLRGDERFKKFLNKLDLPPL